MLDQLDWAEFVLVVCTETYYRRFRGHEKPGSRRFGLSRENTDSGLTHSNLKCLVSFESSRDCVMHADDRADALSRYFQPGVY
jgi:hypothetical protein